MNLEKLKQIVSDFQNGVVYDNNPNYVSLILIEEFLKKKYQEFYDKTEEYVHYIGKRFKIEIDDFKITRCLLIRGTEKVFNPILYGRFRMTFSHSIEIVFDNGSIFWYINHKRVRDEYKSKISDDEKTKEYIKYVKKFSDNFFIDNYCLSSNLGLSVSMQFGFTNSNIESNIFVSDAAMDSNSILLDFFDNWIKYLKREAGGNFYYYRKCREDIKEISINNEEARAILNEEIIGKLYASLKVDISSFNKGLQEEIRQAQVTLKAGLSKYQEMELQETKELQLERLMKAYQLIKEATELLALAKSDIGLEKIKLANINNILFKNNGLPNSLGFIEFEEFFKNNMVLRMLDLSDVDLFNVDIRGIDFSGTNIHINPQIIYNKDMSYVNATDVKFSPFFDSFDGVILDGAIINDGEANIDLNKLRSYNADTYIGSEAISAIR